eukprot:3706212-Rhodomonas_salina.1
MGRLFLPSTVRPLIDRGNALLAGWFAMSRTRAPKAAAAASACATRSDHEVMITDDDEAWSSRSHTST